LVGNLKIRLWTKINFKFEDQELQPCAISIDV